MSAEFRPRRSVLYMPSSNAKPLEKAKTLPIDAVIFDLEDAVAPDAKPGARESACAAASSGAYGIPQSLPASKMGTVDDDWRTNPVTQIRWGLQYIKASYGTPCSAWSAWQSRSPHWY